MRYLKIKSFPKVYLAHAYGTPVYHNTIPVRPEGGVIEICYASKGSIPVFYGEEFILQKQYDLTCNLYDRVTKVEADSFHEHHTVIFYVDYEICEKEDETTTLALPILVSAGEYTKAHELIDEIIRIYTLTPKNQFALAGLFFQLLAEYDKMSKSTITPSNSLYVLKAKEYIYKNLHSPIMQKDIARHLNITPEYLCAIFKKTTGMNLMHFINQIKLSKIKDVMDRENIKLHEAAELYGYRDANYVSRLFKKYYGKNITT